MAVLLVCTSAGIAAAKPSVAILGLEVVDKSGTPSNEDVNFAKQLTEGVRGRAKVGGPYVAATGGDKELIDLKLLKGCDEANPVCMASIGSDLNADILIYGTVAKRGVTYDVEITLLDVHAKHSPRDRGGDKQFKSTVATTTTGVQIINLAKKAYNGLTGQTDGCTIAVKTPGVDRGTILVNGSEKGNITNGLGQVTGLAEGKYSVAIEAIGYHRWTKADVQCNGGDTANLSADMAKDKAVVPPTNTVTDPNTAPGVTTPVDNHEITGTVSHDKTNTWKYVAIGSGVATAAATVGLIVYRSKLANLGSAGTFSFGGNCLKTGNVLTGTNGATDQQCNDASSWSTMTYVTGGAAAVFGGLTIFSIIKAVHNGDDKEQQVTMGHHKHHEPFAITPVVSPSGAGATFRMEW